MKLNCDKLGGNKIKMWFFFANEKNKDLNSGVWIGARFCLLPSIRELEQQMIGGWVRSWTQKYGSWRSNSVNEEPLKKKAKEWANWIAWSYQYGPRYVGLAQKRTSRVGCPNLMGIIWCTSLFALVHSKRITEWTIYNAKLYYGLPNT